jgi:hypothetical protein
MGIFTPDVNNLRDLYINMLQHALSSEKQIVDKGLPAMIDKSTSPELAQAFRDHLAEVRNFGCSQSRNPRCHPDRRRQPGRAPRDRHLRHPPHLGRSSRQPAGRAATRQDTRRRSEGRRSAHQALPADQRRRARSVIEPASAMPARVLSYAGGLLWRHTSSVPTPVPPQTLHHPE